MNGTVHEIAGSHRLGGGRVPSAPGRETIYQVAARLTPHERARLAAASHRGELDRLAADSRRLDGLNARHRRN